ncbi:MAG: hypothetical protein AAFY99_05395 [Pseudomonadota bacterium]
MSGSGNIFREVVWYHKDPSSRGHGAVGSVPLRSFSLSQIQGLWNMPESDPMFDSFQITSAQAAQIQKLCDIEFDFESFDYFLEASAND